MWRFREQLQEQGLLETVFDRFDDFLAAEGFEARQGQVIDAFIVAVPIPRNHGEENRRIKAGELPQDGRGGETGAKRCGWALDEKARQKLFLLQESHQYQRGA